MEDETMPVDEFQVSWLSAVPHVGDPVTVTLQAAGRQIFIEGRVASVNEVPAHARHPQPV